MAKGRLIHKKICTSSQVNALKSDTARLLFTWLLPHLDVEGRFYGDPNVVKHMVFPLKNRGLSVKRVDKYLNDMMDAGLIYRYKVGGVPYLLCPKFDLHQTLRKNRERPSNIPAPDAKKVMKWATDNGLFDIKALLQDKLSKDKLSKDKIRQHISDSTCPKCKQRKDLCECEE